MGEGGDAYASAPLCTTARTQVHRIRKCASRITPGQGGAAWGWAPVRTVAGVCWVVRWCEWCAHMQGLLSTAERTPAKLYAHSRRIPHASHDPNALGGWLSAHCGWPTASHIGGGACAYMYREHFGPPPPCCCTVCAPWQAYVTCYGTLAGEDGSRAHPPRPCSMSLVRTRAATCMNVAMAALGRLRLPARSCCDARNTLLVMVSGCGGGQSVHWACRCGHLLATGHGGAPIQQHCWSPASCRTLLQLE